MICIRKFQCTPLNAKSKDVIEHDKDMTVKKVYNPDPGGNQDSCEPKG